MLKLYMRHVSTGITAECPSNGSKSLTWDLREATMTLVDKVAESRGMSAMEVMASSPHIEIVAKWEIENGKV